LDTGAGNGRRERETTVSTRSYIGIQDGETITAIYSHFDGYPSGVGQVLADHYTDPEKIKALVALGDLSALAPELGERHDFDDRTHGDWCLFYGRDRGEEGVEPKTHGDETEFLVAATNHGTEYAYLFRNGAWWCYDNDGIGMFGLPSAPTWAPAVPLAEAIKAEGATA
jgi:hypothetical protein